MLAYPWGMFALGFATCLLIVFIVAVASTPKNTAGKTKEHKP